MGELYRTIRKNRVILETRRPWPAETADRLLKWETGQFVYSSMHLNGSGLSRLDVAKILEGTVVGNATLAEYSEAQGLEQAALYLLKLAGAENDKRSGTSAVTPLIEKLPTEAELCLLWCFLEGKSEEEARAIWKAKSHLRTMSPVLREINHIPCHFSELPEKLGAFYAWLGKKETAGENPILLAAETHNRLIALYPFASKNEDIARLFAEAVLLANGFPVTPWSMPEDEYRSAIRSYLTSLDHGQTEENGFTRGSVVLAAKLEKLVWRCQEVELDATKRR